MVVAGEVVELGVREEVVVEQRGREGWVGAAGAHVQERVEGCGEVG